MSRIVLHCQQGSVNWHDARRGIPTASNFSKIVTPKGAISKSRFPYMHRLLAEWALGYDVEEFQGNYWTERGEMLEPEARAYYGAITGLEPQEVGFVYKDDRKLVGCSPDWIIGDDGIGEVKCPAAQTHIGYLLDFGGGKVPDQYKAQTQGQLWVTGAKWLDFVSYFPGLPEVVVRVERDPAYQDALDSHLNDFIDEMLEARRLLVHKHKIKPKEPKREEDAPSISPSDAMRAAL